MMASKLLRLGAGGTWPGEMVLKLNKNFIAQMANQLKNGSIVISGTNGKTTTALMIASILRSAGFKVLHNHSGANLLNGLASSFIADANFWGHPRSNISVFELDEANLPIALNHFTPKIALLLNLSRDQLDRYGEVEIMLEKWNEALIKLPATVSLIINEEDKRLIRLKETVKCQIIAYNLNQAEPNTPYPLLGRFNKSNTLAAITIAQSLGINPSVIKKTLQNFKPAFGRGEEFNIKGRKIKIFLAKNPASFNLNLEMILQDLPQAKSILFILNDNIPDGRDVSWIYDIDSGPLAQICQNRCVFVSGKRQIDMTLRLKYAGVNINKIWHFNDLEKIIQTMIQQTKEDELCLILPTYSAMLDSRKILCGKKIL